ncbi:hypothetical protein N7497_006901 [Penicillium chrysogenum]|nr:hypothetical protein N7497_006901 [Penicillium chrysogenum]
MAPPSVLMVGTGEYTTGFVGGGASGSDKKVGVVGLSLFDLRRRGKVGDLSMVGVSGKKFPGIRDHLHRNISQVYNNLDTSFTSFPADDQTDPDAYTAAIDALPKGSAITIFTPTLPTIPLHCTRLSALRPHASTASSSSSSTTKRFDPAYSDARAKAKTLGDFNYFYSYMSQPKSQLETFKAWAGRDSDISYYLNSHHIDICESMVPEYKPVRVTATASQGTAAELGCVPETEDTITLLVEWRRRDNPAKIATGVYTASWTAPQNAGVHSNQYFHYMAANGEIRVNQAKRGYEVTGDDQGLIHFNPFYMRYAPDEEGNFSGQTGYGYISFEKFIDAVTAVNEGRVTLDQLDARPLPTLRNTIATTAILDAGRKSLDERRAVDIVSEGDKWELK